MYLTHYAQSISTYNYKIINKNIYIQFFMLSL